MWYSLVTINHLWTRARVGDVRAAGFGLRDCVARSPTKFSTAGVPARRDLSGPRLDGRDHVGRFDEGGGGIETLKNRKRTLNLESRKQKPEIRNWKLES
jgi:hypothetical protein